MPSQLTIQVSITVIASISHLEDIEGFTHIAEAESYQPIQSIICHVQPVGHNQIISMKLNSHLLLALDSAEDLDAHLVGGERCKAEAGAARLDGGDYL